MKSRYLSTIRGAIILGTVLLAAGCKEDNSEEKKAEEQRFFDIYMASTFQDTIDPPTESGLYYIEVSEGTGAKPGPEDWVLINYVGSMIPEGTVVDTYLENVAQDNNLYSDAALYGPVKLLNGTHVDGLTEGLTLMREGGRAILCFTSDLGFGSGGGKLLKDIPAYQSLKYEVELLEVLGDIQAYEQQRILDYTDTIAGVDTIQDTGTGAVMYYVIDERTHGSQVQNDSVVQVAYRGMLIDGRVFDESAAGDPFEFTVGDISEGVIMGWHFGLARFREGEKGRLIIPYPLAYGPQGRIDNNIISIPPYETLVFEIEVVDVVSRSSTSGID